MKERCLSLGLITSLMLTGLSILFGCDSGEKARDELTGSRAVKQYHQSTKDIGKITDRQTEKHKGIPDDEKQENERER